MAIRQTHLLGAVAAAFVALAVGAGWAALANVGPTDGSPAEVDVKMAVVRLMTERQDVGALPDGLEERQRAIKTQQDERRQRLASVWAPVVLPERVAELEQALRSVAADASYRPYATARFVVDEWVDVEVGPDEANATLVGRTEYVMRDGSTSSSLNHTRYELTLVHGAAPPGGWLLAGMSEDVVGPAG
jgi:hypothetical protein